MIIITKVNWTSEGKYISAMYNQSQDNTLLYIRTHSKRKAEHKWHKSVQCTEPVTQKTHRAHERKSEQETNMNQFASEAV